MLENNLIDPITLHYCKKPVKVTTSDGKQVYMEWKTFKLIIAKNFYQFIPLHKIIVAVNFGLKKLTLNGCFSYLAGLNIIKIELLDQDGVKNYLKLSKFKVLTNSLKNNHSTCAVARFPFLVTYLR